MFEDYAIQFCDHGTDSNFDVNHLDNIVKSSYLMVKYLSDIPVGKSGNEYANIEHFLSDSRFSRARQFAYELERTVYIIQRLLALCVNHIYEILKQDVPKAIEDSCYYASFKNNNYAEAESYWRDLIYNNYGKWVNPSDPTASDFDNLSNFAGIRKEHYISTEEYNMREGILGFARSAIFNTEESVLQLLEEAYISSEERLAAIGESMVQVEVDTDTGISTADLFGTDTSDTVYQTTAIATFPLDDTD